MGTLLELQNQWANPGDVLSLLLLIGGDTVQKAIAQLVGYTFHPFGGRFGIGVAPVAFSFGWVAYGFSNLLSAVGERRLMPANDSPSIVVNCSNAFARSNQSWVLGRLLRDHEMRHEVDASNPSNDQLPSKAAKGRGESMRIDIFELGLPASPDLDSVWWFGWVTIAIQIGIASVAWVLYRDWGVMMIVLCGNILALLTTSLPQWNQEKWAGRTLRSENVFCLTRGNGYLHVMVFICPKGSWDFEALATATSIPRWETLPISVALAVLWICILISVAGLKSHAWYLVCVGGVGMLQNVHAAGAARTASTSRFHLKKFSRKPTIIGKRQKIQDDLDSDANLEEAQADISELSKWRQSMPGAIEMPKWLSTMDSKDGVPKWLEPTRNELDIANVHGALMELEKWVPTAGLSMLQTFFPASLQYSENGCRYNVHKKFWKRAYSTKSTRRDSEQIRREIERRSRTKEKIQKFWRRRSSSTEV